MDAPDAKKLRAAPVCVTGGSGFLGASALPRGARRTTRLLA